MRTQYTDHVNMTITMIVNNTAPHMKAAMAIPATAPAPHQHNSCMVRYSDRIVIHVPFYQRKTAITVIRTHRPT